LSTSRSLSSGTGCVGRPNPSPLRPDARQAGPDAFLDAAPLELCEGGQDVQLQPAGRRPEVDALAEADEPDPEVVQVAEQRDEMPQTPAQPIQPPADQDVEPPPSGVPQEVVQGGPAILPSLTLRYR
jgi:hypothetical protein